MTLDRELRDVALLLTAIGRLVALRVVDGIPLSGAQANSKYIAAPKRYQPPCDEQEERAEIYREMGFKILHVGRQRNAHILAEDSCGVLYKTCTVCGEMLPLEVFPKHASMPGGRHAMCSECRAMRYKRGGRT